MQMGRAVFQQPADVVTGFGVVLPARNAALNRRVKSLNADFKLQHPSRELRHHRLQCIRQMVRYQLKVQKQLLLRCCLQAVQKELQDAHRGFHLEVEGAIDKLEVACSAIV